DGEIGAEEAVKAYHGVLQRLNVKPHRSLSDDMVLQTGVMNYAGNGKVISVPAKKQEKKEAACQCACPCNGEAKKPEAQAREARNGSVDFTKMTPAEKIAYHKAKWDRILG